MNLSGLYQILSFLGPPELLTERNASLYKPTRCYAIGFQAPKVPSAFLGRNDHLKLPDDRIQPKQREIPHIPDITPESVISYAGIFKDVDYLPRRTLKDSDFTSLERTGTLSALARVFQQEKIEYLSRLQLGLFNELAYGSNVLFHSATSTGKTFAMLLYAVLKYYYRVPADLLCERKMDTLFRVLEDVQLNMSSFYKPAASKVPQRVMVLCPTKELAVQSAKQIIALAGGDEDCVRLIIDDQALLPNDIGQKQIFIVGSANQLNLYLMVKEKTYLRGILQSVGLVILDEIDRLLKVTNQYANERKKQMYRKHPTASFQICQTLLAISPNKLQLVGASASISRNHIRFFDNLIQSYRTVKCPVAIIRNKDEKTVSNRYVAVPSAVSHSFAVSATDSLGCKVQKLADILNTSDKKERSICFICSKHSLLSFKHYLEQKEHVCKVLHHEFGIRDNISKRFSGEMVKGLYERRESTDALERFDSLREEFDGLREDPDGQESYLYAASMDSARGLHFPMLDVVYMIGAPRNVNEYIHIAGRVGRRDRPGRCVIIDTAQNIKKVLAWQNGMSCNIQPLSEEDANTMNEYRPYDPKAHS